MQTTETRLCFYPCYIMANKSRVGGTTQPVEEPLRVSSRHSHPKPIHQSRSGTAPSTPLRSLHPGSQAGISTCCNESVSQGEIVRSHWMRHATPAGQVNGRCVVELRRAGTRFSQRESDRPVDKLFSIEETCCVVCTEPVCENNV